MKTWLEEELAFALKWEISHQLLNFLRDQCETLGEGYR